MVGWPFVIHPELTANPTSFVESTSNTAQHQLAFIAILELPLQAINIRDISIRRQMIWKYKEKNKDMSVTNNFKIQHTEVMFTPVLHLILNFGTMLNA